MRTIFLISFILLALGLNAQIELNPSQVQESTAVIIRVSDGSMVYGYISDRTETQITVASVSLGEVIVPISEVVKIEYIDVKNMTTDKRGFFNDFHNSTHNLLFPSGYNLRKGQSYYENIYVFYNSFTYGVTDNISVTAGLEILSPLFFAQTPLVFTSAKFSVPFSKDKAAIALNATYIRVPGTDPEHLTFLSGSFTLGTRNNNVTLGAGLGLRVSSGFNDEIIPFSISTMQRVTDKISIVSENWIFVEDDFGNTSGIISAGLRFHFKDNGGAFNAALFRPLVDSGFEFIAYPYVSATITLGKY